jgi:hypothetical protein
MKPVREIFKDLINLGGRFFGAVCGLLAVNAAWLHEKVKQYDEWEKSYNESGRFDNYQRPGHKFLKLTEMARRAAQTEREEREKKEKVKWKGNGNKREGENTEGKGEDGHEGNNTFAEIAEELSDLYAEHRPDKEIPDFICSDHEYLEIPHESAISETEKECFSADGKLTNEWLSKLLEKYQGQIMDGHADMQNSKNKEGSGEAETTQEKESLGPTQEGKGEECRHTSAAEQEIVGLGAVLPEPTRPNSTVGKSQRKTSEHESKAGADYTNADLIDFEMNEKQIKLEAIKRALKEMVVECVEMQGEEHHVSDEDSQVIIPKQIHQKQDVELDKQTSRLENIKELIRIPEVLLCFEVAWRLAQVIIVGFEERSLVGELIDEIIEGRE